MLTHTELIVRGIDGIHEGKVGRVSLSCDISMAPAIDRNSTPFVEATSTEVGDIHRLIALGIELGNKRIAVRSSGRAFLGLRAVGRGGEVERRGDSRHVHFARGVYSDAVGKVVSLPA